jgi:hypothetical protein
MDVDFTHSHHSELFNLIPFFTANAKYKRSTM